MGYLICSSFTVWNTVDLRIQSQFDINKPSVNEINLINIVQQYITHSTTREAHDPGLHESGPAIIFTLNSLA